MLKILKEDSDIGIYAVAFKFISAGILLPATFVDALFPALNKIHDPHYFRYVINKAFKYLSIIAIPIGLGTLVLAEPLIHFFYNEQYNQSILCLQILSWAMVLMFGNWITGYALISLRKDKIMIMIVSLTAVVNIIANYILIPRWSYIGASVATIISEIIIMTLELIFLFKYVQYKTELIPIIKIFLCAAIMALVLLLLRQNVFFVINALIGIGVFVFLLFITKTISLKELQINK